MLKKVATKKQQKSLVRAVVYLLLAFYFVATSQVELLHAFVHDHEAGVTHTLGEKIDPCHIRMYYNNVDGGCQHESHVVASDECHMCDLAFHGDQTLLTHSEFTSRIFSIRYFKFYKNHLDSYWAVISSSRAPPAHS